MSTSSDLGFSRIALAFESLKCANGSTVFGVPQVEVRIFSICCQRSIFSQAKEDISLNMEDLIEFEFRWNESWQYQIEILAKGFPLFSSEIFDLKYDAQGLSSLAIENESGDIISFEIATEFQPDYASFKQLCRAGLIDSNSLTELFKEILASLNDDLNSNSPANRFFAKLENSVDTEQSNTGLQLSQKVLVDRVLMLARLLGDDPLPRVKNILALLQRSAPKAPFSSIQAIFRDNKQMNDQLKCFTVIKIAVEFLTPIISYFPMGIPLSPELLTRQFMIFSSILQENHEKGSVYDENRNLNKLSFEPSANVFLDPKDHHRKGSFQLSSEGEIESLSLEMTLMFLVCVGLWNAQQSLLAISIVEELQMEENEYRKLRDLFLVMDVEYSGVLSPEEFFVVLRDLGMPSLDRDEAELILDLLDPLCINCVEFREFLRWWVAESEEEEAFAKEDEDD